MELQITETRDFELVWRISQAPGIVDRIVNDAWREMGSLIRKTHVKLIVENSSNHTLLVTDYENILGCFVLDNKGEKTFEVHTMLLPTCRGRTAINAGKKAIRFAFGLPGVDKLISYCPENNPASHFFAMMCGWKKAGVAATSWIQDGIAYPMKIVELARKDFVCR